ncbi:MAG: TetR/AcrR family transcriptional regulator; helix-turn-helix transcriptional regulator [Anaerolineae bacterium]|nr:TetR/AcrR family transcriptional regulator; helix-turn-helix transcriptional regulator [Anaerolineae bacterium]
MDEATQRTHERRQRRAAARRQQILDAAVRVFAEKGFQRATTKDIAEAADIAEGTIYNYFESKDQLLSEILARIGSFEERKAVLEAALNRSLREFFLTYFTDRMQEIANSYPMLLATLPEVLSNPALRAEFYKTVVLPGLDMLTEHGQARMEQGEIRPVNVPVMARLFTSLSLGFMVLMLLDDPVMRDLWQHPDELAKAMETMVFEGLEP